MRQHFLIVEDSEEDAFFIRRAFSGSECRPFVCRNTSEARAYLLGSGMYADRNKFPFPEIVVSDIRLGDDNGIRFFEWLRSMTEFDHLPVVILTASITPGEVRAARKLGATKILIKPSDPVAMHDVIVSLVRELCSTRPQRDARLERTREISPRPGTIPSARFKK